MKRILYVHSRKASFVAIDREILAERYEIEDLYQPGRCPPLWRVLRGVLRADLVFGWFASWHTFFPVTLAWLLRKPSVMIIGGFDTANMPDIGYGYQQGGLRRRASRWIMNRATRLVTNSGYSRGEIERNTPIPPERVTVLHHGVPDPFGDLARASEGAAGADRRRLVRSTLEQKGHRPFVAAAREPSGRALRLRGPLARRRHRGAPRHRGRQRRVHRLALGRGPPRDLPARVGVRPGLAARGLRPGRGRGMLAGCVPVVMNVTAMPEVVGDAGVLIESQDPDAVAGGVREALELGPGRGRRARERILAAFPMESRRDGLLR